MRAKCGRFLTGCTRTGFASTHACAARDEFEKHARQARNRSWIAEKKPSYRIRVLSEFCFRSIADVDLTCMPARSV